MKCSECGEEHDGPMAMTPACHPDAHLEVLIEGHKGGQVYTLYFRCGECDQLVDRFDAPEELLARFS